MTKRFPELTGFVLAGGASRRMGRPKHELMLDGETLLARMVRRARAVAGQVIVLGPPERAQGLSVAALPDEIAGRGPLGAIYTGLIHTRTEFNLFLSCDLPFVHPRFLSLLAAEAIKWRADATLAATLGGGLQPLAAIYRRRARAAVRRSLERGRNKLTRFFPMVSVRVLRWPELARAGFQDRLFDNLNTVGEYERAVRRVAPPPLGLD